MSGGRRREPSSAVFVAALVFLTTLGGFAVGLASGIRENRLHDIALGIARAGKEAYEDTRNLLDGNPPRHFLQPARKPGEGVTVNRAGEDRRLVLLAGFFDGENGLRLIRRDGTLVASWRTPYSAAFPDTGFLGPHAPRSDRNVDLHGALITPEGAVVFNFEYAGTVRLSRCGAIDWTLAHQTHHSVEPAEAGGYWIAGRRHFIADPADPMRHFPPFTRLRNAGPFSDDLILRVDDGGRITAGTSLMRLFYDNGLAPVLTATGESFRRGSRWGTETLHLNKITELPAAIAPAFPMFEAGDLMVSLREYNLIAVIDPDDWRVKWHQTGPWQRQHDPEFLPDGRIAVFDNGIYRNSLTRGAPISPEDAVASRILTIDPADRSTRTLYGGRPDQPLLSVIRGKIDPTAAGGFLITEFEGGRAVEVDAQGEVIWEYINRHDAGRVAEITEARAYDEDYFTVTDWTCPAG